MAANELTAAGGHADESTLVGAAAGGDQRAFAQLFHRHRAAVRAVCVGMLRDPHDVEEAVQDTFAKAYAGLPRLRPGSLEAWLREIARNVCIDELRRRRRRPPQLTVPFSADIAERGPRAVAPAGDRVADGDPRLDESLARVPPQHRSALELRFVHDLSHREIGAILGKSPFQVKALVHRARRNLRLAWEAVGAV